MILSYSLGKFALWSLVKSISLSTWPNIALESPTHAAYSLFLLLSITHIVAVVPENEQSKLKFFKASLVLINEIFKALSTLLLLFSSSFKKYCGNSCVTKSLTLWPYLPCPSNTANNIKSSWNIIIKESWFGDSGFNPFLQAKDINYFSSNIFLLIDFPLMDINLSHYVFSFFLLEIPDILILLPSLFSFVNFSLFIISISSDELKGC